MYINFLDIVIMSVSSVNREPGIEIESRVRIDFKCSIKYLKI